MNYQQLLKRLENASHKKIYTHQRYRHETPLMRDFFNTRILNTIKYKQAEEEARRTYWPDEFSFRGQLSLAFGVSFNAVQPGQGDWEWFDRSLNQRQEEGEITSSDALSLLSHAPIQQDEGSSDLVSIIAGTNEDYVELKVPVYHEKKNDDESDKPVTTQPDSPAPSSASQSVVSKPSVVLKAPPRPPPLCPQKRTLVFEEENEEEGLPARKRLCMNKGVKISQNETITTGIFATTVTSTVLTAVTTPRDLVEAVPKQRKRSRDNLNEDDSITPPESSCSDSEEELAQKRNKTQQPDTAELVFTKLPPAAGPPKPTTPPGSPSTVWLSA